MTTLGPLSAMLSGMCPALSQGCHVTSLQPDMPPLPDLLAELGQAISQAKGGDYIMGGIGGMGGITSWEV